MTLHSKPVAGIKINNLKGDIQGHITVTVDVAKQ